MVNFAPVPSDNAATLDKIEANVREAARQGIELLAFPEEALAGAEACNDCLIFGGPCDTHVSLAETIPGPAKLDFFVHITEVRAAESVCYAMAAHLVGGEDGAGYGGADLNAARAARLSG